MIGGTNSAIDLVIKGKGYGFAQVDIAINTADPFTRCTYPQTITVNGVDIPNSCYGYTPASSASNNFAMNSWDDHPILSGIKPVLRNVSTGEWSDLPLNASTWTDTTNDCFTEFPFQWLSITNDGTKIRIIFSDKDTQPDSTFQCYAHAKACDSYSSQNITSALSSASRTSIMNGIQNNYFANSFHIGCFYASGGASGAQVYSKKDQTAAWNVAYAYFFKGANARGSEFDIMSFQQWTYLQALFVLLYKSTNSQTAHSHGLAKVGSETLNKNYTNNALATTQYGMAGKVGTAQRNAFFWIHDLWGNIYQFIGGLWNRAQSSKYLYYWLPRQSNSRAFNNGWNQATSYAKQTGMGEQQITTQSSAQGNFIKTVYGTNVAGFAPATSGGSQTTYYSDSGGLTATSSYATFPNVGGYASNSAGYVGIFYCYFSLSSAHSTSEIGSRLSYRGGHYESGGGDESMYDIVLNFTSNNSNVTNRLTDFTISNGTQTVYTATDQASPVNISLPAGDYTITVQDDLTHTTSTFSLPSDANTTHTHKCYDLGNSVLE